MKAKFVHENISFERGKDPKKSMDIGASVVNSDPRTMQKNFRKSFPEVTHTHTGVKTENALITDEDVVWKIISVSVSNPKDGIDVDTRMRKFLDWFKKNTDYDQIIVDNYFERSCKPWGDKNKTEQYEQNFSFQMRNRDTVYEEINFERGEDPKRTMRIGKAGLNPFMNGIFRSMKFWEYLQNKQVPNGSIRWAFLKAAADLLDVKGHQVLVAIDNKGNNLNQYDLEEMGLDDWTTSGEEIEINDKWYLSKDTNDVVYVISTEEGERFILGKNI
jgi:hypothetical protein